MPSGFRVGRYNNARVYVDGSWLFIGLLLTWSLTYTFMRWHPAWGTAQSVAVAALATAQLFASVLAHELAHAAMERRQGGPARSVTLWAFGGVTDLQREPRSPGDELMAALAGPAVSFALGVFFLAVSAALGTWRVDSLVSDPRAVFSADGALTTLLLWLGPINLALGLFNLLPAFPLDGGRVLRAALWSATGDLRKATRWASGVGQLVAWTFIVAGVAMAFGERAPLLGAGFVRGLWTALIGWFLFSATLHSMRQTVLADVLGDVSVGRLMRRPGPYATPGLTIDRFVTEWLLPSEDRAWPVIEGQVFRGMVCLADVRRVPRERWGDTLVAQIMTPAESLVTASPDAAVSDALDSLARRDVAQLPVVSRGELVGVLFLRDVMRWIELQSDDGAPPSVRSTRPFPLGKVAPPTPAPAL